MNVPLLNGAGRPAYTDAGRTRDWNSCMVTLSVPEPFWRGPPKSGTWSPNFGMLLPGRGAWGGVTDAPRFSVIPESSAPTPQPESAADAAANAAIAAIGPIGTGARADLSIGPLMITAPFPTLLIDTPPQARS